MEAAQKKAQKLIDENAVMVFSKSYCPYCRNTKRILDATGVKYEHYELDQARCVPPVIGRPWHWREWVLTGYS